MPWILLFWTFVAVLPFSFALNPATGVDLSLVRVLVPVVFMTWLGSSFTKKNLLIDKRVRLWLLCILLFLSAISCFWAIESFRAIRKILFLASFAPLYFVSFAATRTTSHRLIFFKILVWSGAAASVFALSLFSLQFIAGINSALAFISQHVAPIFLGNTFSDVVVKFPSWLVNIGGVTMLRAFGTFPDPHLFSLYINLILPFVCYLFIKERKKIYLFVGGALLISSLLAFSRAAYLSLIAGALFMFLASNPFSLAKKYLPLSLGGMLILFFLIIFPNPLTQRLQTSFDANEGSNRGRIEMWRKGLEIIKTRPLTGIGIGNFSRYVQPTSHFRDPIYAHNLFLDFGAETGLPGATALLLLLLAPIISFAKKPTLLKKFIATAFVIFIVHSFFETPFYSVRVFPLVLMLLSLHSDD